MGETEPERSGDRQVAVAIRDLVVDYQVYSQPILSGRQLFSRGFRTRRSTVVRAIDGITTDFFVGEATGIVGSNGSGKSTLLRTVAGLQRRSAGAVHVASQPQFLGVAAALNPRVSGHHNVILGGLALGLTREEVNACVPDVMAFSGLDEEMTRPLYTFSSGMKARLAMAIALLRTPDILLLDEALAVGDRQFRDRSLDRVEELREGAGTVLMVSHSMSEISRTCSRTLWLDKGKIRMDGPTEEVIEAYSEWDGNGTA